MEKLKELLFDISRNKNYDDIHNLIVKYLEEVKDNQLKNIIVKNMNIDYCDRSTDPIVQLTFILPPELLKHKTWTIDNVLSKWERIRGEND